jgi:hypothetical protein
MSDAHEQTKTIILSKGLESRFYIEKPAEASGKQGRTLTIAFEV